MRFTMRERTFFDRPGLQFSLAVLLGGLLGLIGPFGSFGRLGIERRVVHWVVLVGINWGLVVGAGRLVARLPVARSWPPAALGVAAALAAAVPGAVATRKLVDVWGWWPDGRLLSFGEMMLYVAAIGVAVSVPMTLLLLRPVPRAEPPPLPPSDAPAFLRRIPPRLGRDLVALEAEDHYLRIHTRLGSDLVLMRIGDAEAELAGLEGARVHRSWWVVRAAVVLAERMGQGARLTLITGQQVPVSRSKTAELKRAGWF